MDHVEFVYTVGMTEAEVEDALRAGHSGVLALADDGAAYAVPLSYQFDGERFRLRLSDDGSATKLRFLAATRTASFLVHEATPETSWSVLATGSLDRLDDDAFDDADLNRWFPPLRVFDEATDELAVRVYTLTPDRLHARRTVQ